MAKFKFTDPGDQAMFNVVNQRNKDKNFVKRGLNPMSYPNIKLDNGEIETHRMSYSTGGKNSEFIDVYPDITQNGNKLEYDKRPYWEREYIRLPGSNPGEVEFAKKYAENGLINHNSEDQDINRGNNEFMQYPSENSPIQKLKYGTKDMKTKKYNLGTKGVSKYPDGVFKKAVDYKELPVQGNYSVPEDKPISTGMKRDAKGSPVYDNFEVDYSNYLRELNKKEYSDTNLYGIKSYTKDDAYNSLYKNNHYFNATNYKKEQDITFNQFNNDQDAIRHAKSKLEHQNNKDKGLKQTLLKSDYDFLKYINNKKEYFDPNEDYEKRLIQLKDETFRNKKNINSNIKHPYTIDTPYTDRISGKTTIEGAAKNLEYQKLYNKGIDNYNDLFKSINVDRDINTDQIPAKNIVYPNGEFPKNPKKYNLGTKGVGEEASRLGSLVGNSLAPKALDQIEYTQAAQNYFKRKNVENNNGVWYKEGFEMDQNDIDAMNYDIANFEKGLIQSQRETKKYNLGVQKVDVSSGSQGNEKFLYGNQYGQMGAGLGGTLGSGIGMIAGGPMGAQVGKLAGTALGYGAGYLIGNQKGKQIANEMDTQRGNELNINRSIDYQNDNFSGKDMYQDKKMFENTGYLDNKQLYAKYGLKNAPKEKIEVEKDEMIFRKDPKNGRTMLVADFKGGDRHEEGGEDFLAQDGDIIYPGKMRDQIKSLVGQDGYVTDEKTFEAYRQQLPEDNESQEMAMGTGGYLGLANDIMNTGSQLMNFNKNIKAMDKQMLSGQTQMPQQQNKAMGSILGAGQSLLGMLGNKQGGAVPIPEYKNGTRKFGDGDPDFTTIPGYQPYGYQGGMDKSKMPIFGQMPSSNNYDITAEDISNAKKYGDQNPLLYSNNTFYAANPGKKFEKRKGYSYQEMGDNYYKTPEYFMDWWSHKDNTPTTSESQGNELGYKGQDTGLGTQLDNPENMVAAFQKNNPITPFDPNYKSEDTKSPYFNNMYPSLGTNSNFNIPNLSGDVSKQKDGIPKESAVNKLSMMPLKTGETDSTLQPSNLLNKLNITTNTPSTDGILADSKSSFLNMVPNIIGTGANMLYAHGLTKERSEKRDATRVDLEKMKYQDRSNPQRLQNLLGSKLAMKNATNYAGGSINNLLGASAMSNAAYQQQANQIEQGESGVAMGIDQQNVGIKNQQNILNGQYFDQNKTANEMNDAKTRDIQRQGRLGMATTANQSIQNAQTLQKDNLMQKESDRRYGLQEKLYGNQLKMANEQTEAQDYSTYASLISYRDKYAENDPRRAEIDMLLKRFQKKYNFTNL